MKKNPINMEKVFKRKMCLEDSRTYDGYGSVQLNGIRQSLRNENPTTETKLQIMSFLKECASLESANRYYKDCIGLVEMVQYYGEETLLKECVSYFKQNVIPFCKDTVAVTECVGRSTLNKEDATKISEALSEYKICDRILDNHNKLSKRFKTNDIVQNKYTTIDEICSSICEMVDTYDIPSHIKMELCFEETLYLLDKHNIAFKEADMVEAITNYFLSIPMNESSVKGYRNAINRSPVLTEQADHKVQFLTREKVIRESNLYSILEDYGDDKIKELLDNYKMETEKTDSKFKQVLNKIFTQSPANIIEDTPDILRWIRNFGILFIGAQTVIGAAVAFVVNGYLQMGVRKDEAKRIIRYFENERDLVSDKMERAKTQESAKRLNQYYDALDKAIGRLTDYNDSLYTDDERMNQMDEGVRFESFFLEEQETKIVVNSLIADAIKADEFIDKITTQSLGNEGIEKTDVKDTLTKENYQRYIDADSRISMVLCSFDTSACNEGMARICSFADSIVKSTNNMLSHKDCKVYYTMLENSIDFILRSTFKIITSLREETIADSCMTDVELFRANYAIESAKLVERLQECHPERIIYNAIRKIGSLSKEQATMFVEAWTMGSMIEEEDMSRFISEYQKYQTECGDTLSAYTIPKLFESGKANRNTRNMDLVIESTIIMADIVNEAFDLNSLKLSWMAFKKKAKGLSAKEQEMSRDMDSAFNNMVRSLQSFVKVTDNRERVMKGQVVPSVSKMMKIGVALAVSGVASGSVLLPAIAAVTGLVLSKKSKDKEKKMWLDEIDIELQIVERELKRVEDGPKSQSKKYRNLLTFQKNLQREKQRITYNLSQKGHSIVSSTKGIGGGRDD